MISTGFLLIDKPAGITSHDVVDKLRRITGIKKIGHAGTLDPFATGLLLLAVSRESTKRISEFVGMDKVYEAEFVIGATTETLDTESEIIVGVSSESSQERKINKKHEMPPLDKIKDAMKKLTGPIEQIPPMYSAIKKDGKKLYELARAGKTIVREPRKVTIHEFDLIGDPREEDGLTKIDVKINCASGTYIRALARDLAIELGTTGYVTKLRRTSIDKYEVKDAKILDQLNSDNWQEFLLTI